MSKFIKHGDLRINLERVEKYGSSNIENTNWNKEEPITYAEYQILFHIIEGQYLEVFRFRTKEERDEFLAKIDKLVGVENE